MMGTNLRGVFLCTRAVLPGMKDRGARSGFGGIFVMLGALFVGIALTGGRVGGVR